MQDYEVATVQIQCEGQKRDVHVVRFEAWKDHKAMDSASFKSLVSDAAERYMKAPMLIHCSAGVGRTSVLWTCIHARLLSMLLSPAEFLKRYPRADDLFRDVVFCMVKDRGPFCPQTVAQLKMIKTYAESCHQSQREVYEHQHVESVGTEEGAGLFEPVTHWVQRLNFKQNDLHVMYLCVSEKPLVLSQLKNAIESREILEDFFQKHPKLAFCLDELSVQNRNGVFCLKRGRSLWAKYHTISSEKAQNIQRATERLARDGLLMNHVDLPSSRRRLSASSVLVMFGRNPRVHLENS